MKIIIYNADKMLPTYVGVGCFTLKMYTLRCMSSSYDSFDTDQ